jgi:hypothetical protein
MFTRSDSERNRPILRDGNEALHRYVIAISMSLWWFTLDFILIASHGPPLRT